jgi:hypothetical protein
MSTQTVMGADVSAWGATSAAAECRECEWTGLSFSPAEIVRLAVFHAKATGHEVDLSRKARALVTPQVEPLNPHVQRTWTPGSVA